MVQHSGRQSSSYLLPLDPEISLDKWCLRTNYREYFDFKKEELTGAWKNNDIMRGIWLKEAKNM
jgi:hypothetical protein